MINGLCIITLGKRIFAGVEHCIMYSPLCGDCCTPIGKKIIHILLDGLVKHF